MKGSRTIVELLVVVIGVFVGMLLNSWNEQRKERTEAELHLEGIQDEMLENVRILQEAIPYHKSLLEGLRTDPLNIRLSLNPTRVDNIAWKLAETSTFKNNIDKDIYMQIAKTYQIHEYLISIQDQADERMSELNVIGPYYELQLLDKDLSEEDVMELQIRFMQAWIPMFESWTHLQDQYLNALQGSLKEIEARWSN